MASIRTAGALLAAGLLLLSGCANNRKEPRPAPPPSMADSMQMRDQLLRADPSARVGIVTAAAPDVQLVSVREVPAEAFQQGDSVQFLDARGQVVGDGTVERVVGDAVHVHYATGGTRAPTVGDLAIRTGGGAGGMPGGTDATGGTGPAGTTEATTPDDAGTPGDTGMPGDAAGAAPAPRERQGAGAAGGSRLPPRRPTTPPSGVETTPAAEAPDAGAPDAAPPDQAAPDQPAPDAATPDDTAPDAAAPPEGDATEDAPAAQDPPAAGGRPDLNK